MRQTENPPEVKQGLITRYLGNAKPLELNDPIVPALMSPLIREVLGHTFKSLSISRGRGVRLRVESAPSTSTCTAVRCE